MRIGWSSVGRESLEDFGRRHAHAQRLNGLLHEAVAMCSRNSQNGGMVRRLEEAFAKYVKADYAIALCNGTATLHTALVALGVKPGDTVAVPPLTMASTTLGVLHAGATPVFRDVHPDTWLLIDDTTSDWALPVGLYGLGHPGGGPRAVYDGAETLNRHNGAAFTSYSFQASKILPAGEGGMLVTNDLLLALKAREISRLGYPPLDRVSNLKDPKAERHICVGWNYRMSDLQAAVVLAQLERADELLFQRKHCDVMYRQATVGCDWVTWQYVPEGWPHSCWASVFALNHDIPWETFATALTSLGGERPYAAWRLTYQEPAFRHLAPDGTCPIAEDLQPRLVQLATNHDAAGAERAAEILRQAIRVIGG